MSSVERKLAWASTVRRVKRPKPSSACASVSDCGERVVASARSAAAIAASARVAAISREIAGVALDRAQADLASGLADAISFGRPFLANPDLVDRLREGAPLTQAQMATFYSQGAEGYTDYPTLAEEKAAA